MRMPQDTRLDGAPRAARHSVDGSVYRIEYAMEAATVHKAVYEML